MPATISPLTRLYLVLYNALSFGLWATCTLRTAALVPVLAPAALNQVYVHVHSPLLTTAQTLALLEIVHSLVGIVRAPLVTTAMQVASRLMVVWGVMYPFGGKIVGSSTGKVQIGDYAFLGCLFAWGITECIRYGFFVLQVSGLKVPGWWMWLRYSSIMFTWVALTSQVQYLLCPVPCRNRQRMYSGLPGAGTRCPAESALLVVFCRGVGVLCSWYVHSSIAVPC